MVSKTVQDATTHKTQIHRYRCSGCGRTFRDYPGGIDRSSLTQQIRRMAGLVWVLGLSSRAVVETFSELGVSLSHSTVWRDGQNLVKETVEQQGETSFRRLKLVKDFVPHVSSQVGVVVAIDLGRGKSKVLGTLNERNSMKVASWLRKLGGEDIQVALVETGLLVLADLPGEK